MKFYRDGFDYISICGNYVISNHYGWWAVWYKDRKVYLAETLKDAKAYCEEHANGAAQEYDYVI